MKRFWVMILALCLMWPARSVAAEADGGVPASSQPTPMDVIKPLMDARRFDEAETAARDLLAKAEGAHGKDSVEAAQALDALVHVLLSVKQASLDELRSTAERAVAIKEARLGRKNLEFAASLNNLGRAHLFIGNHEESRDAFQEVAITREALLGGSHVDVGKAWNNVAVSLVRLGELAAARPIYERVIAIFEKAGVRDYPELTSVRNNLALLLKQVGELQAARALLEQVVKSQLSAEKTETPDLAARLGNLGDICRAMNDLPAARRYWERVVAIWSKDPGEDSSAYAVAVANLGKVMLQSGQVPEGRKLIERGVALFEKLGQMETKGAPALLTFEADALALGGEMTAARDDYARALRTTRAFYGESHPYVAEQALDLAGHLYRMRDAAAALEQALISERITREHLRQAFPILSEREAIHYELARKRGADMALTILSEDLGARVAPDGVVRTWDALVRSRAMVLGEMSSRLRGAAGVTSAQGQTAVDRLATARNRVSRLLVRGPSPGQNQEVYQQEIKARVEEREKAERELAQTSDSYRRLRAAGAAGLDDVIRALGSDTALVAYSRFSRISPVPGGPAVDSYAAMTLDAGSRQPRLVPLGPAAPIDAAIGRWRQEAGTSPGLDTQGRERACASAGDALRALIWDPVWSTLHNPRRVIVVPDGALNLVSLGSLAGRDGRYLVESGPTIHYMAAEKDMVRPPRPPAAGGELLIVGGPDFDAARVASGQPAVQQEERKPPLVSSLRSPRGACAAFASLIFDPLPQARAEADQIASLWARSGPVRKLTGPAASEAAFKAAAPGASALHVSTHAFFMAPRCDAAAAPETPAAPEADFEYRGEPAGGTLLFSGLALAGANRREDQAAGEAAEDGILTAEEIAALDLSRVEWVVLSACETGVGKVLSGDGVLGLRRAFETSTSGSLIMSLWKVEDDATRVWMEKLYRSRLGGLTAADSVQQASLDTLKERRSHGLSDHPFFWGGFVASGDWR